MSGHRVSSFRARCRHHGPPFQTNGLTGRLFTELPAGRAEASSFSAAASVPSAGEHSEKRQVAFWDTIGPAIHALVLRRRLPLGFSDKPGRNIMRRFTTLTLTTTA